MGAWLFVLLSISITVVIVTGRPQENENTKPCLTWKCSGKRAFEDREERERPCLAWDCKREMLLRKKFLNAFRGAESANKKSSVTEAEDKLCLAWECRRKRRALVAMPTDVTPEAPADDMPCLTGDCRAGKRSNEDSSLMKKLRFARANPNSKNDPGCLAWMCNKKG
ncbi:hypothetical protein ACROYT_G019099 [Oculina patagonica]